MASTSELPAAAGAASIEMVGDRWSRIRVMIGDER